MAQTTCPACKGSQFEYKEAQVPETVNTSDNPRVPLPVYFIQCASCGVVVGVTEAHKPSHP